jgi:hypothetical protein
LTFAVLVFVALPMQQASADDPLGFYVGGAIGQSNVKADPDLLSLGVTWSF